MLGIPILIIRNIYAEVEKTENIICCTQAEGMLDTAAEIRPFDIVQAEGRVYKIVTILCGDHIGTGDLFVPLWRAHRIFPLKRSNL
ncbi:hypothetical protein D3C87_1735470 [compost metagenome]